MKRSFVALALVAIILAVTAAPALATSGNVDRWPSFNRATVSTYCLAKPGTLITLTDGTVRISARMYLGKPVGKTWLFTPNSNVDQLWGYCPTSRTYGR